MSLSRHSFDLPNDTARNHRYDKGRDVWEVGMSAADSLQGTEKGKGKQKPPPSTSSCANASIMTDEDLQQLMMNGPQEALRAWSS